MTIKLKCNLCKNQVYIRMDIEDVDNIKSKDYLLKKYDESKLSNFLDDIIKNDPKNKTDLENYINLARRKYKIGPSKSTLLHLYRNKIEEGIYKLNPDLEILLIKKLVRIMSGVEVITIFTSPNPEYTKNGSKVIQKFSCGKNCAYCPLEKEININCKVLSINFNGYFYNIKFKSFDKLDEIRVITYILLNNQILYCRGYSNFDETSNTFEVQMIEKYANKLNVDDIVTCRKVEQTRSYISTEPGVRRANQSNFNAILQFFDRASSLEACGQYIDKLEILVLGGTWSHYPIEYQEEFIRDIYYAANIFYSRLERLKLSLEDEIKLNEKAKCRIIGLTLETRPDCINKREIIRFRKYNCTRVQLGVQHIDDSILKEINRGCYTKDTINALRLLKKNGFKVDYHLMPDLPSSSYEIDKAMFSKILGVKSINRKIFLSKKDIFIIICTVFLLKFQEFNYIQISISLLFYLFLLKFISGTKYLGGVKFIEYKLESNDLQADQWKIYPTEVTRWTKIYDMFQNGEYKPYAEEKQENGRNKIVNLILNVKKNVFPWIRLNRVIRDIPDEEIYGGNLCTNLRQHLHKMLKDDGDYCKCIRCREVKDSKINLNNLKLMIRKFNDNEGNEYFISFESLNEKTIYGFCRLRLNNNSKDVLDEIKDHALVRELHVYGVLVPHYDTKNRTQHIGLGKKLLKMAEYLSYLNRYKKIAVISGVGVRQYYQNRGYNLDKTYMKKNLNIFNL